MRNAIQIDDNNYFMFDFVMLNEFKKLVLIQLKIQNRGYKKDIKRFITNCHDIDKLNEFLAKYNLGVYISKRYSYCDCAIIETRSTAKKKTIKILVPSATDIVNNIMCDDKYSDLD